MLSWVIVLLKYKKEGPTRQKSICCPVIVIDIVIIVIVIEVIANYISFLLASPSVSLVSSYGAVDQTFHEVNIEKLTNLGVKLFKDLFETSTDHS